MKNRIVLTFVYLFLPGMTFTYLHIPVLSGQMGLFVSGILSAWGERGALRELTQQTDSAVFELFMLYVFPTDPLFQII